MWAPGVGDGPGGARLATGVRVATTAALIALVTATALALMGGVYGDPRAAARDPLGLLGLIALLSWPAIVPAALVAGHLARSYVNPRTSGWTFGQWAVTGAGLGMATGAVAMPVSRVLLALGRGGPVRMSPGLGAATMVATIAGAMTGVVVAAYCRRLSHRAAMAPMATVQP